jgi:hypothetical protein
VSSASVAQDLEVQDVNSNDNVRDLQNSLFLLANKLNEMKRDSNHPFGFGVNHGYPGRKRNLLQRRKPQMSTHAFHGKRSYVADNDDGNDVQNTEIFHGKREALLAGSFPSSTSAFHGKREGMESLLGKREVLKSLFTVLEKIGASEQNDVELE